MKFSTAKSRHDLTLNIDSIADLILQTQKVSGEIPWHVDGKTDPWDHIESAMGLGIGGYLSEAKKAFDWMTRMQLPNGSWYASYKNGIPKDKTQDTNLAAYIAVGIYHHYLISDEIDLLHKTWDMVHAAIEFTLSLQTDEGEIYWAINPEGQVDKMSLLTGSSSIYMSIKCALAIAKILGHAIPSWNRALKKLENAIIHKPYRFNMTKSRFSMDWFYPILCGAVKKDQARKRIDKYWKKYIIEGQGVRCVYDEPWVTIAETSELSLTLSAMGNYSLSEIVFNWISNKKFDDGTYWCGFTFPDMIVWPEEKITWTNAVALMAADALYHLTPASCLFSHKYWESFEF